MLAQSNFRTALAGAIRPLVGAHRGASDSLPENTMPAFAEAIRLGADFLELDVQLAADNVPVVIHDATLERTVGVAGIVRELSVAELAKYGVPSLREVLDLAPAVLLNIELKADYPEFPLADAVISLLHANTLTHRVLISSFQHELLSYTKYQLPEVLTGMLYEEPLADPPADAVALGADAIHPYFRLVDAALIRAATHHSLAIIPWTVDRPGCVRYLSQLGVTGIITNKPASVLQQLLTG